MSVFLSTEIVRPDYSANGGATRYVTDLSRRTASPSIAIVSDQDFSGGTKIGVESYILQVLCLIGVKGLRHIGGLEQKSNLLENVSRRGTV